VSSHGRLRRLASRRGAWALLLLLVVGLYGAVVAVAGGRDALTALRLADPWPLVGALLAQVVVTCTWPLVHRASVVAVGGDLRYPQALNVSMSAFTVSHTVPGGGAVGAAIVVERLTGFGVAGPVAAASATLTGPIVLTTVGALGVLGLTGAVLAGELPDAWLVVGLIGLAALVTALAVIVAGLRSPGLGERVIAAVGSLHRRLPVGRRAGSAPGGASPTRRSAPASSPRSWAGPSASGAPTSARWR
jgi:uncharacterized membrane protein YbhN (UPF0104 family)